MMQILNKLIFIIFLSAFFSEIINDFPLFNNNPLVALHQSDRNPSDVPDSPFCIDNAEGEIINCYPSFESGILQLVIDKLSLANFMQLTTYSGSIFRPPRFS
jgi:hypothetical protein